MLDAFVKEICSALQLDEAMATNVCLAVEEAVVNVMRYAYTEGSKGEIRGQESLACCSSWDHKESDMAERLNKAIT